MEGGVLPLQALLGGVQLLGALVDGKGLQVPAQAFLREHEVDRCTLGLVGVGVADRGPLLELLVQAEQAALLVLPLMAFAQSASCPVLTRSLSLGSQGDDVKTLQRFLTNEGELVSGSA